MFRPLALAFLLLPVFTCGVTGGFAQTSSNTAPTKWERYAAGEENATILMPKLPLRLVESVACSGEDRVSYGAYANGNAYVLSIVTKKNPSSYCRSPKIFSEESFGQRLDAIRNQLKGIRGTPREIQEATVASAMPGLKISSVDTIYQLYNDYPRGRWFELQVFGADLDKPEIKNFLESFKINKTIKGIDIGKGAPSSIGDETAGDCVLPNPSENRMLPIIIKDPNAVDANKDFTPLRMIFRPKPAYTESGRREKVNGSIRLRVTFSAAGNITEIQPIDTLTNGLEESAIEAATKMLFVPAQKGKVTCTQSRIVEYNFTIF